MIPSRRLSAFIGAAVVAFTVAGCGDDSVNPANPDAGAAKDAVSAETGEDEGPRGDAVPETTEAAAEGAADAGTGDGAEPASD